MKPLVDRTAEHDRELSTQIRDAATSALLNTGEGNGRRKGSRRNHFEIALGSAREVRVGLRGAEAWGYIAERDSAEAKAIANRLGGVLRADASAPVSRSLYVRALLSQAGAPAATSAVSMRRAKQVAPSPGDERSKSRHPRATSEASRACLSRRACPGDPRQRHEILRERERAATGDLHSISP